MSNVSIVRLREPAKANGEKWSCVTNRSKAQLSETIGSYTEARVEGESRPNKLGRLFAETPRGWSHFE